MRECSSRTKNWGLSSAPGAWESVSVFYSCCNKLPQTWLRTTQSCHLTVLHIGQTQVSHDLGQIVSRVPPHPGTPERTHNLCLFQFLQVSTFLVSWPHSSVCKAGGSKLSPPAAFSSLWFPPVSLSLTFKVSWLHWPTRVTQDYLPVLKSAE